MRSEDLDSARDAVRKSGRAFLVRLYHARLIVEGELRQHADTVGVPIEPEDLEL